MRNVKTSEEDKVPQDIKRIMCMWLALVHSVAMKKFQTCIYESGKINWLWIAWDHTAVCETDLAIKQNFLGYRNRDVLCLMRYPMVDTSDLPSKWCNWGFLIPIFKIMSILKLFFTCYITLSWDKSNLKKASYDWWFQNLNSPVGKWRYSFITSKPRNWTSLS